MKIRDNKGSITIFVLVGLLFMTGFLIISFGSNINKSKSAKEQFNIISSIYSHNDGDEKAYQRAYTELRKKKAQTLTSKVENSNTLNLTKTFANTTISDYKIYGNSIQDTETNGTPSPTNPVEVQSVGDMTSNLFNLENATIPSGTDNYINLDKNDNRIEFSIKSLFAGAGSAYGYVYTYDVSADMIGTTMCISAKFEKNGNTNVGILCDAYNNSTYLERVASIGSASYTSKTFTIPENTTNIKIRPVLIFTSTSTLEDTGKISDIMLNIGNNPKEYEPYGYKIPVKVSGNDVEPQTYNIYLNEPLRKVGNSIDTADYIDFNTGKVVRRIKKAQLTAINTSGTGSKGDDIALFNNTNYADRKITETNQIGVLSDKFKAMTYIEYTNNNNKDIQGVAGGPSNTAVFFKISKTLIGGDTVELCNKYLNSNPIYIYYIAEGVELEDVNLPELKTYEDYTNIEVLTEIAPSKIEATYYGYTME